MKITILGSGDWGTGLFKVLKTNTQNVSFWDKKLRLIDADMLVISVPTQSIRQVLSQIEINKPNCIVVNTSKGIEQSTHKFPFQIVNEIFGNKIDYYALIGPSFSKEVQEEMPTLVNLGFSSGENKELVKQLFQTDYFRVKLVQGVEVLELFGAFKNVYAIVCGMADGLGFKTNTRVKLMMIGMEELNRLIDAMNLQLSRQMLPGTIGDLILTCNSDESRNFRFGRNLAKMTAENALTSMGTTVEGYFTISSIDQLSQRYNVKLPLIEFIEKVIKENDTSTRKSQFIHYIKSV